MTWMRQALLNVFRLPVKWLVKTNSIPADVGSELGIDKSRPIIYLLPTDSVTDQLALQMSASSLGLPSPVSKVTLAGKDYPGSLFLRRSENLFRKQRQHTDLEPVITDLFQWHREHTGLDVQVVPVFITWGRAPGKGKPGLADLLTLSAAPSWLRKFFIVLFLGRDTFISYSRAVSSRAMTDQHSTDAKLAHKLARVASTHFHRKRQAMTGPTLLERQALNNAVLGSEMVRNAISEEMRVKKLSADEARNVAAGYLKEIAADYREGLIRFGDRLLTRIWNKIYNGISVGHANRIRELANNGHEIIYIPCHRSHMDYLLLTYVIYHEGLVTPHIAAGINLNFWPVGGIFRRGGAFFLRRSFAGNKLYTAVFREYLELLFKKGYAVKYYPEGGRSRTGRLIPPKTGMLAMTIQAAAKGINRPISLVPVYIGYENVMEVKSYLSELKGGAKKKESNWQVFSAIKKLKNYGHGYVNFGDPLSLNQFLDSKAPDWRGSQSLNPEKKPAWLTPTVNSLAGELMTRVNSAAAINGMALTSLCLLASKTQTMSKTELTQAMTDYLALFAVAPYSKNATLPKEDAKALLEHTLSLKRLNVSEDQYGTLISPQPDNAVFLTYYRNNIIHLFALPGIIMTAVFAHGKLEKNAILQLIAALYPLLQRELFLHMSQDQALAYTAELIDAFKQVGMLQQKGRYLAPPESESEQFHSSWLLSRCMQETLQRYAVVLTILKREKSISRNALEKESKTVAERLSRLYGMHSPEFYDKNVLSSFISALRDNHWLDAAEDGSLKYSEEASALRKDIMALVWPEIVQHLQQNILQADREPHDNEKV
ncbi:glycerol-3-phosphate 1-O-acyltransferase PlsB [Alteromonas lipolytica]|uniref:Glycerol-3-phosphate acyltransferase n=1 Tax=Alteromonas lipolytica TaxID=1856405 RepID=A0A1E8FAN7_9ALTE|nr:glycerol-3-phosphate 1-O-acyltransferase PlsB [Alteromonas lipolytica]OFI32997.1 glycerol-3-phosphate 1-O-acyltransferase [Alteromonas lipolytica]GGF63462.1 glycerol-3-phosphate acyltransferase [Alteromonas lipolytica]